MLKILAIGNSFSEDATEYLHDICLYGGKDVFVQNIHIGGCSLERHYNSMLSESADYVVAINGQRVRQGIITEEINAYDWDIITLQQVSNLSGNYETFQPYLDTLASYIKEHKPDAKLYWHKTWAYDITHAGLALYNNSQEAMAAKIDEASLKAVAAINADGIIPCGDVIAELRKFPEFDMETGGQTLCRDGKHLHMFYGRYAVAATWYETLLGGDVTDNRFIPPAKYAGLITPDVLKKIDIVKQTVHKVCSK